MVQRIPLPLTVSCFSKIQIGITFLVPAHTGSPGQRSVKRAYVCVCLTYLLARTIKSLRRRAGSMRGMPASRHACPSGDLLAVLSRRRRRSPVAGRAGSINLCPCRPTDQRRRPLHRRLSGGHSMVTGHTRTRTHSDSQKHNNNKYIYAHTPV